MTSQPPLATSAREHPVPAEARLRAAQYDDRIGRDQLLALIDNTSSVIYMRDMDGRYMLVNREFERRFGLRRDAIVGLTDHDLFPAELAAEFRASDLRAAASETPIQIEEDAPGEDGEHTFITVRFALLDAAAEPYAVCGISTDITDRKRAEEKIQRLSAEREHRGWERNAELEATTRELDAFAYSVSHDLRAPLRSLDGFSQVLLEDYADCLDDTGKDYLRRLQSNVARMAQMIDDLLDLSRASRVDLVRKPVDVSALVCDILADLRAANPERPIEAVVADGVLASCDQHLVRLVLVNLLSNAWKFTAKEGHGVVEFGSLRQDGEQVLFVRDNGAGFDMRYAEKLFDPFQRLHDTKDFAGNGVGLAIVHRVIARHGGRVWAAGEPGVGATFSFTLTPHNP
ncbi:MAG TPA: ATP-binding protein [Micromonosporaceae bacterium]|nr:ATP-binding protein [Micromonosporaceae bacterium]